MLLAVALFGNNYLYYFISNIHHFLDSFIKRTVLSFSIKKPWEHCAVFSNSRRLYGCMGKLLLELFNHKIIRYFNLEICNLVFNFIFSSDINHDECLKYPIWKTKLDVISGKIIRKFNRLLNPSINAWIWNFKSVTQFYLEIYWSDQFLIIIFDIGELIHMTVNAIASLRNNYFHQVVSIYFFEKQNSPTQSTISHKLVNRYKLTSTFEGIL